MNRGNQQNSRGGRPGPGSRTNFSNMSVSQRSSQVRQKVNQRGSNISQKSNRIRSRIRSRLQQKSQNLQRQIDGLTERENTLDESMKKLIPSLFAMRTSKDLGRNPMIDEKAFYALSNYASTLSQRTLAKVQKAADSNPGGTLTLQAVQNHISLNPNLQVLQEQISNYREYKASEISSKVQNYLPVYPDRRSRFERSGYENSDSQSQMQNFNQPQRIPQRQSWQDNSRPQYGSNLANRISEIRSRNNVNVNNLRNRIISDYPSPKYGVAMPNYGPPGRYATSLPSSFRFRDSNDNGYDPPPRLEKSGNDSGYGSSQRPSSQPPLRLDKSGNDSGYGSSQRPSSLPPLRLDKSGNDSGYGSSQRPSYQPPLRLDKSGDSGYGSGQRPSYQPPARLDKSGSDSGYGSSQRPSYRQFSLSNFRSNPEKRSGDIIYGSSQRPSYQPPTRLNKSEDSGYGSSQRPSYPQFSFSSNFRQVPDNKSGDSGYGSSQRPSYQPPTQLDKSGSDSGYGSSQRPYQPLTIPDNKSGDSGYGSSQRSLYQMTTFGPGKMSGPKEVFDVNNYRNSRRSAIRNRLQSKNRF